jgi:cystathionine gamma-synthase
VSDKFSLETLVVQADHFVDQRTGAIVPSLEPSTTFARNASYELIGESRYSRYGNPTCVQAERILAKLDGGREARLFASGLAACAAVLETVRQGQHVLAPRVMYHGAQSWMRRIAEQRGFALSFFDQADPKGWEREMRANTALVWVETPVNPTWDVIDIAAVSVAAHAVGAAVCVDSSVAPPVTTRPLSLGADIVFHSASKYLNGHGDILAGVLVTKEVDARWTEIAKVRDFSGGVLGAFEAWLLMRGLRTLFLRFERASTSALSIARHFEKHRAVEKVLYPGLARHPGHDVAKRQMTNGFGGMLSLCVKGGDVEAKAVASRLELFLAAASLGGVESLVEHRASVEGPHSVVPKNLLRLSIGIETPANLIADLEQALAALP